MAGNASNSSNAMIGVDDILVPNPNRFVLFPLKYHDVWELYQTAMAAFWVAEELDLNQDVSDWEEKLNDNERYYIKHVLAFFAGADGIVNENLAQRFMNEIQVPEIRFFYAFQMMIENVHSHCYSLFIDTYIKDNEERRRLFDSIEQIPCIKKKAAWAQKWIENDEALFGERLLAFACVEGIFFSGSFAAIYWIRKRGLMPGLCFGNDKIAADEGLHTKFAALLFNRYLKYAKPSVERTHEIIKEAVEIEKEFQSDALPVSLIGMNVDLMKQYIEFVADYLLGMLNMPKIYNTANPFSFMELISMQKKENFFENRVSQYQKPLSKRIFTTDEEF